MYSFARHNHGLAWVTLSAISLFVHGCGSMSADNPAGNGAAAGTESVSPASDTLFSTIETPDFGRYDLVARGPDDGSGEWQFAVRSGRGAPTKNELRFVWDFGDGKTYEGVEQSYSFTTNGSYVIKVTAIKLDGAVAFILTLNVEVAIAVNEPPIADAGTDQTADANALVFLYGGASSDPDGDPLTYRWVQISGEPVLLLHANEPTASFIAPSIPQDADLVFGVTVGDGGYNAQDSVVVRVLKLVQPAALLVTADAGADQLNVLQGTPVTLDGSGSSSSNGSPLTYAWSWSPLLGTDVTLQPTTDPAIVTFTAPGLAQGETSLDLFFELVVSAGDQSASDEVRVTVTSESLSGGTVPVPPVPTEPCVTSSPTWQNMSLTSQSGSFEFQFDAVPNNANMDGIVALSQGAGATFADYAVIVRFDLAGSIDIRDGATYAADASVPYSAGTNYHFRVLVNGPARTYNVYVTPEGGTQETLATDYAFRSEQSSVTSLANWAAWSDTGGSMDVCNAVLAVVALTASAGPDVIMAPGGAVTLSGSASGGELPYTYRWSPTTGLDNASAPQPTARPSATTTYTLTVTDSVGASAGDSVVVTVQNAPLAAGAGPDVSVQPGGSITLQGSASGGTPSYTFRWSPTTGLNNANIAQPTASPAATTTYTLTVTDSASRTASDSAVVIVQGNTGTNAIAVWGFQDKWGVSGVANIGVAAYHETGMQGVTLTFGGIAGLFDTTVTDERLDPATRPTDNQTHPGYPYFYAAVDTTRVPDGDYTVGAVVTPNFGLPRTLAPITLRIRNSADVLRFVDGTIGNDSWDGTSARYVSGGTGPWRTLGKAASSATQASGVTRIVVAAGSYAPTEGAASRTSYLQWTANPNGGATVQAPATLYLQSFNAWDGFKFAFTAFSGAGGWEQGIRLSGNHHITFRNCEFFRPAEDHLYFGVYATDSRDLGFLDSTFRGWGTGLVIASGGYGSAPTTRNVVIRNNKYTRSMGSIAFGLNDALVEGSRSYDMANYRYPGSDDHPDGIQFDFNGPMENIMIRHCAFWHGGNDPGNWNFLIFDPHSMPKDIAVFNNWAQIYFQAPYSSFSINLDASATHMVFVHNTVMVDVNGAPAFGMRSSPPWRDSVIKNNILDSLHLGADEVAHNSLGHNVYRASNQAAFSPLQEGDVIDPAPGYLDEANYDVRLGASSPYSQYGSRPGQPVHVKYDYSLKLRDPSRPSRGAFEAQ